MPSAETRDQISWMIVTALGMVSVIALFVRLVVKPWAEGLMEPLRQRLDDLSDQMRDVRREVTYNGGSSIKDAVRRIEDGQRREHERGDRLERAIETHARAQAAVWPAIEAVAKASPPADD